MEEATADMKKRGLPMKVIKAKENLMEHLTHIRITRRGSEVSRYQEETPGFQEANTTKSNLKLKHRMHTKVVRCL